MLRIRLVRHGKNVQPFFRIVVAEHARAVKRKNIEVLGNYNPKTKALNLKKELILAWIQKGAIPSDSAASLFQKNGLTGMEKYLEPRNKKRAKKTKGGETEVAKPEEKKEAKA